MIDILHTIDLGLGSHIIGSVFWYVACVRKCLGGGTQQQQIQRLADDMSSWYKRLKVKARIKGKLTVERVRPDGGWAKLKAHGAGVRHLAPYALHLICKFGDPTHERWGQHDELALGACQLLVRFYEIVAEENMFMPPAMNAEMARLGEQLASMYVKLSVIAFDAGLRLWKLQPKLHLFIHLCIWQAVEFGNPAYWWTYGDEDLVGQLIDIAETVHATTIHVSLLVKWVHCVVDELLLGAARRE